MKNVVLAGGGTGGHLFAALAFADYLRKNGFNPIVVGSIYGIERDILNNYDFEYFLLKSKGIVGKSLKDKLAGTFLLSKAVFDSIKLINKINPDFCVGFGGYVSLPVMIAAKLTKRKTAILEQNSIPGKTNKFLNKLVDITFVNFDITKRYLKNCIVVGNPTRVKPVDIKRSFKDKRLTIGVIGGSRGARSLNKAMVELSDYDIDINVIHQTGRDDYVFVMDSYAKNNKNWKVYEFIEDMESFYRSIDFIICRAGASTLSEIACAKLGSLLIPYPYAIYDHQYFNARYFKDNLAAEIILDKDLSGKKIYTFILSLTVDRLKSMSENAFRLCKSNTCEVILKELLTLK